MLIVNTIHVLAYRYQKTLGMILYRTMMLSVKFTLHYPADVQAEFLFFKARRPSASSPMVAKSVKAPENEQT